MPNYIRQLTPDNSPIPFAELQAALKKNKRALSLTISAGTADDWTQLLLAHKDGGDIAMLHRMPVTIGSAGADQIQKFLDEIKSAQPESAVKWLEKYLGNVKCIYAFEIRPGANQNNGFGGIHLIRMAIQERMGGIIQSDNEGFSNEDEYHILWQFPKGTTGAWWMALLQNGTWMNFQMQLGNAKQREAFLRGEVPPGAIFE